MPPLAQKPPPYPTGKVYDEGRNHMRRFSIPRPENDQQSWKSAEQSPMRGFRWHESVGLFRRQVAGIKRLFAVLRKHHWEAAIHASIVALALVFFAGVFSLFVADDLRISGNHLERTMDHARKEAVAKSLHDQFAVPNYIIHRFEASGDVSLGSSAPEESSTTEQLLAWLLSRSELNDTSSTVEIRNGDGSRGIPRIFFATIDASNIGERVRAVASTITYATNTGRIPVIFWGLHRERWSLPWAQTFKEPVILAQKAVLVDYMLEDSVSIPSAPDEIRFNPDAGEKHAGDTDGPVDNISNREDSIEAEASHDWAELSVVDLSLESPAAGAGQVSRGVAEGLGIRKNENPSSVERNQKVTTRDDIRTFDTAAAVDAHVAAFLRNEVVSRYAPAFQASSLATSGLLDCQGPFEAEASTAYAFEYALGRMTDKMVLQRLHDYFEVPYMLLQGMKKHMHLLLLRQLVAKEASGIRAPRVVFIHVQYGLGNRLRALGSAMAFAKETNRALVVIWEPDHHLDCEYGDLFVETDDIVVSDNFGPTESWPFEVSRAQDSAAQRVAWYNYMRVNGEHVHDPSELVLNDKEAHIYISSAYVVQSLETPYIIRTQSHFWAVMGSLTPQVSVARMVERLSQMPMEKMMGVHIRSKLIKTDISGVGVEEYTKESSSRTDYWRSLTQVDTFLEEMKRQPSSQLFYVAADQIDVLEKLQAAFPSRIFYTARQCEGRDRACLPYALADILLLAKCPSIRGSYWSSFSEIAIRIGGGRVLLAGIDFGRPSLGKPTSHSKTESAVKVKSAAKVPSVGRKRRRKRSPAPAKQPPAKPTSTKQG